MESSIKNILKDILKNPISAIKSDWYAYCINNTQWYRGLVDNNPKRAIEIMWYRCYQKPFPWNNPITLNEKICWLAGMTDTSKWTDCSDKYEVRKYIKSLGLKDILTKCYGVWDNIDDINFEELPQSFAIKCTHDCGSTVLVENKSSLDKTGITHFLRQHLNYKMGYDTCEPHYTRIKPRIMAEELLHDSGNDVFSSKSAVDYKMWCINGKVEWVFVCYDRHLDSQGVDPNGHSTVFDVYDVKEWKPMRHYLTDDFKRVTFKDVPRPKNLNQMIDIAEKISSSFHQVRVDLYNIQGKIYFGEMTFTSQGGRMSYYTDEFQKLMGSKINLK